jgi:uncharacterized protein YqeY
MYQKLKKELLKARKNQDTLRVSVLGYLLSALQNKEIDMRAQGLELSDKSVVKTIKKQIKGREEMIANYEKVGNSEMAQKEAAELEILKEYLAQFEPTLEQSNESSVQS